MAMLADRQFDSPYLRIAKCGAALIASDPLHFTRQRISKQTLEET
jgi:hypothetical protein